MLLGSILMSADPGSDRENLITCSQHGKLH